MGKRRGGARGGGDHIRALLNSARRSTGSTLPTDQTHDADWVRRMIVAGQYTRERACDEKSRFAHYSHAAKAKADLEERHGDPGQLMIYPCPFCAGFHFAHNKDFKGVAVSPKATAEATPQ